MNRVARIVLLNGVGSAGKTSVAKALRTIADEPFLHVQMDAFMDMLRKPTTNILTASAMKPRLKTEGSWSSSELEQLASAYCAECNMLLPLWQRRETT